MSRLVLLLVVANLLWGSGWVVAKLALSELTPLQVSAWRMIVAGAFGLPWLLWLLRRERLPLRVWPRLIVLGAVGFVVSKYLNFWGLARTSALDASLLMASEPLLTIVLGVVVLRESLGRRRLVSFALGACGAYLIVSGGWRWPGLGAAQVVGNIVFLIGLLGEAAYTVFGKSLLERHSAVVVTMATVVASAGLWGPVALWDAVSSGGPPLSLRALGALVFLGLGCTVLAYWAWFHALERLEAGAAALTIFVQPLWGAALAAVLLGEPLTAATLCGAGLVLVGLYLAEVAEPAAV